MSEVGGFLVNRSRPAQSQNPRLALSDLLRAGNVSKNLTGVQQEIARLYGHTITLTRLTVE